MVTKMSEGGRDEKPNIVLAPHEYERLLAVVRDAAVSIDELLPYIMQVWAAETVDRYEESQEKKMS